ncbi:hypothetical protein KUTeg_021379 [Tegillarca granosa]|uniref:Secreted protein n=1 Tax=Tegillarca granosa TaxID=220873 RepID=A0ABQ9EAP9_TEGGR|nr:hypothetical protein KUTeg_021379 [Tegillarca granosa]
MIFYYNAFFLKMVIVLFTTHTKKITKMFTDNSFFIFSFITILENNSKIYIQCSYFVEIVLRCKKSFLDNFSTENSSFIFSKSLKQFRS